LGLALYFASQGAGRLLWPFLANCARLVVAVGGGWLALRWTGEIQGVFAALAGALVVFGLINAFSVAGGAWFRPIAWPRPSSLRLPELTAVAAQAGIARSLPYQITARPASPSDSLP